MTILSIVASNDASPVERIKPKERDGVVQALRTGVVPRSGVQHVQVGRVGEIKQVVLDVDRIVDGGSAVRFAIGDYGSGKTFFLSLGRSIAIQKKLVVFNADLSPDVRLRLRNRRRTLLARLRGRRGDRQGGGAALAARRIWAQD
jgi:hypothetical protein